MARHTGGWVKFWRKAALGDINSNYTRGGLFGALIAMANIQDSTVDWGGKPRTLVRGELVTSIQELADIGETDRRTVDRHLAYLQMRGTLTYEKRTFGTFIRITNYEQYQGVDADSAKPQRNDMQNDTSNDRQNHSAHNEELKNKRTKERKKNTAPAVAVPIIPTYCESYKERYGHNPVIGKKQSGILTRFAKNHPYRWEELVRGYLRMPDSWAVQRSHPVEFLDLKVNEIIRFLETGKIVTKKVSEQIETEVDKIQGTTRNKAALDALIDEREKQKALLLNGSDS